MLLSKLFCKAPTCTIVQEGDATMLLIASLPGQKNVLKLKVPYGEAVVDQLLK